MSWPHIASSIGSDLNMFKDLTVNYQNISNSGRVIQTAPHLPKDNPYNNILPTIQVTLSNIPQSYTNAAIVLFIGVDPSNNKHGEVLLLKLNYGSRKWSTPGGNKNGYEGALQTALRETREETGLNIDMNNISDLWTIMYTPTDTKLFVIMLDKLPGKISLSNEHTAYKLVEWDRIVNSELTDYTAGAFAMIKDKMKSVA